jgi:hypothetical protein
MDCEQEVLSKYLMKEVLSYPFKSNTNIYKYVRTKHYATLEDKRGGHRRLRRHYDKIWV